ncbi:MAG: cell shape-determining protein, partial [Chloroflexaceae bacterium]
MSLSALKMKMFTRVVLLIGLALGVIGGATIIPRPARANVQPSCSTSPLYTNGTFVTAPGFSMATLPDTGWGFLAQPNQTEPNDGNVAGDGVLRARLADDFVVTGNGWRPSAVTLYGYQIDSPTTSTINGVVDLRLWNGIPGNGGAVIAGPIAGTIIQNTFTNVYRVRSDLPNETRRPIMAVTITWPFSDVETLAPGTYWLEYGLTGSNTLSGPW